MEIENWECDKLGRFFKIEKPVDEEIKKAVLEQKIYWNNEKQKYWFFDFKLKDTWISCININLDKDLIKISLYKRGE